MRLFPSALLAASIAVLVGCALIRPHQFKLLNQASREVTAVRVEFGDAVLNRDRLGVGETISFSPATDTDGGVVLSYEFDGQRVEHQLGYVAPPVATFCDIRIVGRNVDGGCR